jgi:hypothetical protein
MLGAGTHDRKMKIYYEDAEDGKTYVHELGETSSVGAANISILLVEVAGYGKSILLSHLDGKPLWEKR